MTGHGNRPVTAAASDPAPDYQTRGANMKTPEEVIAGAADLWACDYSAEIAERAMQKLNEYGYEIVRRPMRDSDSHGF